MTVVKQSVSQFPKLDIVPRHIGFIMDGNGRWAQARGLPRLEGHRSGIQTVRQVLEECMAQGIKVVTFYTWSTENWRRPRSEALGLMQVLREGLETHLQEVNERGVRMRFIGSLEGLDWMTRKVVETAINLTKDNSEGDLVVAYDYGGRAEILKAFQRAVKADVHPDDISEDIMSRYLDTAGLPDPDLIVRTSGEMRLSNFLVWQSIYSELYFTPTCWPDFNVNELHEILSNYILRKRKYGGLEG